MTHATRSTSPELALGRVSTPNQVRVEPTLGQVEEHVSVRHTLEPTDGGLAAWKCLGAAFVFEALLWGFPLSFGVFQNYYSQLPEFANDPFIPFVGSIASGTSYLGGPFMAFLTKKFPKYQRHMIWLGWPLCISGLVAASFANTLPKLIVTQGIMYAVGFVFIYYPLISMINEWWIVRRGMAFGIISSASGASGCVMPFILQKMLNQYGYRTTLLATAVALTVLTGPLIPFLKGRLPPSEHSAVGRTDWSFLQKPLFWVYCASTTAQGLGFSFPSLYLPSYASSIGLSATQGALLLAIMSISQVLGQWTFGFLSDDRFPLDMLIIVSTMVSSSFSLALWGFSSSLAPLVVFALVYGFFAYGYSSMRARMCTKINVDPSSALAMFGVLCFGQGVGNVLAGPISMGLLNEAIALGSYGVIKYQWVVVFTGSCMLLSALSVVSGYLRPRWGSST
ncbi:MFS general substrate transporter [Aspergillus californicus]